MTIARVLVVDDEPLARRRVRQLLEPFGGFVVIGEADDGHDALALARRLRPDVLFLDVHMPGLNGFDVLAHPVAAPLPLVVFLTAHAQFASRAFDVSAVDYLLKPIRPERFRECMQRLEARLADRGQGEAPRPGHPAIVVEGPGGRFILRPDSIDWIEAADYYANVHAAGAAFLLRESLDSLEGRLPAGMFLRIHRSSLVNVACVRMLLEGDAATRVQLRDGTILPVSRRRRREVRRRFAS